MENSEKNPTDNNTKTIKRNNNKEIVTNMKEVINSAKMKRKYQHRRRKENIKRMEPDITDISTIMNNTLNLISPNVSIEDTKEDKTPLKEATQSRSNGKRNRNKSKRDSITLLNSKSPMKMMSIKDHFSPKSKNTATSTSQNKKLNAFELMMNARNKSIGSNSPGKDPDKGEIESIDIDVKGKNVKRKLVLEEWAEKKGALKRKLEDESRDEYIEYALNKRAKRLKKLLTNGTPNSSSSQSKEIANDPTPKRRRGRPRKEKEVEISEIFPDSQIEDSFHSEITSKHKNEKKPAKGKIKGRKIKRRVSSSDSVDLIIDNIENTEKDKDDEFLAKLSSPLKKRDSLLGYFPKIVSPTAATAENLNEGAPENKQNRSKTKKKRVTEDKNISETNKTVRKQKLDETLSSLVVEVIEEKMISELSETGRPRRSCVGKTRYDKDYYCLDISPNKDKEENNKKREHKKISTRKSQANDMIEFETAGDISADLSSNVIDLESSTEGTPLKMCKKYNTSLKLAPVFIKPVPKPSPDPVLVKARQEFLMSGIPEKMRLEIIKQKQFEQAYEEAIEYFPKISHILQTDFKDLPYNNKEIDWGKCNIVWRSEYEIPTLKSDKIGRSNLIENLSVQKISQLQKLPEIPDKRLIVKNLKIKYDKFPSYRCYNQLREKYKAFSAKDSDLDTCEYSESFVVTRTLRRSTTIKQLSSECNNSQEDENIKPPSSAPNGELLFTEKYKPMTSDQVLVNLAPVKALKEFLSPWIVGRNMKLNDSIDDLEMTNDSSTNSMNICNSVVLLGPSSSGKTNAVFALANELNFNVLEINAGMKRNGKKLLQELHEATQSHQVSRENSKKKLLKKSMNGFKKKPIDMHDSSSSLDKNCGSGKMSLILVEDADIVFEQDAGFVEAIYQLSITSKRPVIITANNPNCQHLLKLINQQVIHFYTPKPLNISRFLSILSLIENCPIELDEIIKLYLNNKQNVRKTLLEMQFFIQSGGDRKRESFLDEEKQRSHRSSGKSYDSKNGDKDLSYDKSKENTSKLYLHRTLFDFYTLCQNTNRFLPFPIDYDILSENLSEVFKACSKLQCAEEETTILNNKKNLETIKKKQKQEDVLDVLTNFYENISTGVNITKGTDCVDLCCPNVSEQISHHLVEQSVKIILEPDVVHYSPSIDKEERILLTSYMPTTLLRSKRSLALEYEPCLRSICRSEKSRSQEERRGSRFYHYLRNTCTNVNTFSTELYDNSCSILRDSA